MIDPYTKYFCGSICKTRSIGYQIIRHLGTFDYSMSTIDKIIQDYKFLDANKNLNNDSLENFDFEFNELEFKTVSLNYNNSSLLSEIEMSIKKNDLIAIIGESGSERQPL